MRKVGGEKNGREGRGKKVRLVWHCAAYQKRGRIAGRKGDQKKSEEGGGIVFRIMGRQKEKQRTCKREIVRLRQQAQREKSIPTPTKYILNQASEEGVISYPIGGKRAELS